MMVEADDRILTIPNLLTLIRLLLLPVYLVLFLGFHNDVAAFIVFMIAASTDFLDGLVARLLNQVSRIGQQFDPLVDRLLIVVGVVGVFIIGRLPLWILILLLARDAAMLVLTVYQKMRFDKEFEVVFLGKVTTVFAMAGFCGLILGNPMLPGAGLVEAAFLPGWGEQPGYLGIWLLYIGMILSITTAAIYIARGVGYARHHDPVDPKTIRGIWPISPGRPVATGASLAPKSSTAAGRSANLGRLTALGSFATSRNPAKTVNLASPRKSVSSDKPSESRKPVNSDNLNESRKSAISDDLNESRNALPISPAVLGDTMNNPHSAQQDRLNLKTRKVTKSPRTYAYAGEGAFVSGRSVGGNRGTGGFQGLAKMQLSSDSFRLPLILRVILAILAVFIIILLAFYCFDGIRNFGKIHTGVTISGVEVGSMTIEQASELLERELAKKVASTPVNLFASTEAANAGINSKTADLTGGVASYKDTASASADTQSWSISAATLGLAVDGKSLAEQAYAVGRGKNSLFGRITATFAGVALDATLKFAPAQLHSLERIITNAIGYELIEAFIYTTDQGFKVNPGSNGFVVNHEQFVKALNTAYLSDARAIVVPMSITYRVIDEEKSESLRAQIQAATEASVEFISEDGGDSWVVESKDLRSWVTTLIVPANAETGAAAKLVANFDAEKIILDFGRITETDDSRVEPVDASFKVDEDGKLIIVDSIEGSGIDYTRLALDLDTLVFGAPDTVDPSARSVTVYTDILKPQLSTEQAEALGITNKIASYTTEFISTSAAHLSNIHLAGDIITGSLIAPNGE
ncbi:MAG: CDP-alcohol phosphatidyltransferase family protein, partial [Coriobacteriia bacterium]|nr:CDP-alcohol phosphatidyltransferase family protein [Coriobacteriia bacterium]